MLSKQPATRSIICPSGKFVRQCISSHLRQRSSFEILHMTQLTGWSHSSPGSNRRFPHTFFVHMLLQLSASTMLPSSHSSFPCNLPSPQISILHMLLQPSVSI